MKRVIIFGFGEMGKKLTEECLRYDAGVEVLAIADNKAEAAPYHGIPVILPSEIGKFLFDEIWVCTVYFKEIMRQLVDEYGVEREKIHFTEPVMPVLEKRLRKKYEKQLRKGEAVSGELGEVLQYLNHNPLRMYCYAFYDEYLYRDTPVFYDERAGLYFGLYENKKMYLAKRFDTEQKARAYLNGVLMEQDERSPHCYWNDRNMKQLKGVGVDVGAAEGIFALKIINQAEHIYLAEVDSEWIEALHYTFEPFEQKVTIVPKFIADKDDGQSVRLDTLLKEERVDFLKMDIEGVEYQALQGAENLLAHHNVQLALCVYHNQDDNQKIAQWLGERGYRTRNSPGFVVCQGDWELEADAADFRRGLLFACKE